MAAVNLINKIKNECKTRSEQEIVLLSCSALGILYIPPFIIYRIINEDWAVAAIDAIVLAIMLAFFKLNYGRNNVSSARVTMSVFLMVACVAVVYIKGLSSVFWYFPAVIVVYYLMPPASAVVISITSAVTLSFILFPQTESIVFASILVPCTLMNLILYITFNSYRKIEKQLTRLVTLDALTGIRNRRSLTQELANRVMTQRRSFTDISLVMFDLDNFKSINDRYGHLAGDEVLIHLAKVISLNIRAADSLYRYGGEEFVLLLPETSLTEAADVCENLRKLVETYRFPSDVKVTISMGAARQAEGESAAEWLERADAALYKAKQNGRNCVEVQDVQTVTPPKTADADNIG